MRNRAFCAVAATLLIFGACSARGGITATLDEYSITLARTSSKPGDITFTARNIGSIAHQLLVLKTERRPDKLGVRKGVVDIDAKRIELIGELRIIAQGDTETLSLTMQPGNYVLICNIASHYPNGMHAPFRVR